MGGFKKTFMCSSLGQSYLVSGVEASKKEKVNIINFEIINLQLVTICDPISFVLSRHKNLVKKE